MTDGWRRTGIDQSIRRPDHRRYRPGSVAYLAELLLLAKGYVVHGVKRRSSSFNTERIEHPHQDLHEEDVRFFLHYGDMTDSTNLIRIVQQCQPDEIYNWSAQSWHVQVSFETCCSATANADAPGTCCGYFRRRSAFLGKLTERTRFYQASTSEPPHGVVAEILQKEMTSFNPAQPLCGGQALRLLGIMP